MSKGYGRGGRGAALLEALADPPRPPGEAQQQPEKPQPTEQKPKTRGRGLALQKFMSTPANQSKDGPPSDVTAAPPSGATSTPGAGPAVASAPSGATAAPSPATPASAQPKAKSMGRGLMSVSLNAKQQPAAAATATAGVGRGQPQPAPAERRPGQSEDRVSKLQHMLDNIALESKPDPSNSKSGTSGCRIPLSANYIRVKCLNHAVIQYAVSYEPVIDSLQMRRRMLFEHTPVIGEVRAFDGAILFLPHELPQKETVLKSKRLTDNAEITITIKMVAVIPPEHCVQVYNVLFRNVMRILQMCQISRQYFDPLRAIRVPQHRLEVWPGYVTAVKEYQGGLMMLADVTHKVLRTDSVLDVMYTLQSMCRGDFYAEAEKRLLGAVVLTRYNNKTYRIDDIDWNQHPTDTFQLADGTKQSYVDYYKINYNKTITDLCQPLLVHRPKPKELRMQKGRHKLEVICLIPELCKMTGLTDDLRSDFRVMKDLASHTRINPNARILALRKYVQAVNNNVAARNELRKWGLELEPHTVDLEGRTLLPENIFWGQKGQGSAGEQADWGRSLGRESCIVPVDIRSWLLVYPHKDRNRVHDLVRCLKQVCPAMGIDIMQPVMAEVTEHKIENYLYNIRSHINQGIQLVCAILPVQREDWYNAIKKVCCIEQPVPSQVIISRTLADLKKLRSVVIKVALQMNVKLGGELWAVKMPNIGMMVCGIDTYHHKDRKARSVGAFVSSLNDNCTRWYSKTCQQLPGEELISGLQVCFISALRKYHEVNHQLPKRIVIFRDGVGDGDIPMVREYETAELMKAFKSFGQDYQPHLTLIVVQKRINTRILKTDGRDYGNPPSGTVVDHTITRKQFYDFFLVSQHVRQGTVTPTHYIVVQDTSSWEPDKIQRLSYKLTHLYYNWPGTVRVPAPCQYAHKLAYQVGENLRAEPSALLADRLFYI